MRRVAIPGVAAPLSFDLGAGECLVLLDEDERRRTALLRLIARADDPASGTVTGPLASAVWHRDPFADDEPVRDSLARLLREHRADVGADDVLGEVALTHRAEHEPWAMSVGERRRIAIAAAFADPARLVVLDEPERGLDVAALHWVAAKVADAASAGRVVVIATHDARLAQRCGDFVVDDLDALA